MLPEVLDQSREVWSGRTGTDGGNDGLCICARISGSI